jgi:hypothetical protein
LSPINALTRYQGRLKQHQLRIAHHKVSIERAVMHLMKSLQQRWHQRHEKLLALAPVNVLSRGFAILRKNDGTVVTDASQVEPGEHLQAILKTGSIYLQVGVAQAGSTFADPRAVQFESAVEHLSEAAPVDEVFEIGERSSVFDPELADPTVLAKIFGDEVADLDTASSIFRAGTSERLQLAALQAELIKDLVPTAPIIEGRVQISHACADADTTKSSLSPELVEEARTTKLEEVDLPVVQESTNGDYVARVAAPPNQRHRVSGKSKPKVAAHQLKLFQRSDEN